MSILRKLFNSNDHKGEQNEKQSNTIEEFDTTAELKKKPLKIRQNDENLRSYLNKKAEKRENDLKERIDEIFPRKMTDIVAVDEDNNVISNYAMDGMDNIFSSQRGCYSLTNIIIDRMTTPFIGWSQCAIVAQNWIISRALTIPASDAISSGWKLSYFDNAEFDIDNDMIIDEAEQKEKEKFLKLLEQDEIDYNIAEVCKKANYLKKTFGYCLVIPVIEGADMSKPFNIDGISKNSYKGLAVVEPMWITPQFDENSRNPINKDFYEPSSYRIAGSSVAIHKSWIIKLVNSPVPDILKPVYFWGGIPLTQMIFERVYCAEKVANEAPMLAMTKRLMHIEGDLENAIANPELFEKRMEFLVENQDNYGYAVIPFDSKVGKLETSLTDFDQLIMTQYQLVSSIAQMPVTKLMKIQLKGFYRSGQYEQDDYNQSLVDIQTHDYTPIIRFHNELICKSKYGKQVDLNITFNEIDSPTAKENAEIRLADTQRDVSLVNAGILKQSEVREKMRNDENSLYTSIVDDDDIIQPQNDIEGENIDNDKVIEEEVVEKKTAEIV
jgi:hypothetical protein